MLVGVFYTVWQRVSEALNAPADSIISSQLIKLGGQSAVFGRYQQLEKMKVSHVLYKVINLQDSVTKFQNMGFKVEFGSKNKPHNALIYFSEGPYIEL